MGDTFTMPDGAVYARSKTLDYVVDVSVRQLGAIVLQGWVVGSSKFSLLEENGAIVLCNTRNTNPMNPPTWVVTDVWCSDRTAKITIGYRENFQRLSGPWLESGIHLMNPIQVGVVMPIRITLDDGAPPSRVALKGFIANGM